MQRILLVFVSLFLYVQIFAQTHTYRFFGNFNESSNIGPALTEVLSCNATAGSYGSQIIAITNGTCGTTAQQVFAFNEGGGLSYPNNSFIGSTYTINIFFEFNALSGYQRIIDFKNSTTDRGMYTLGNCLNFYPNGNVGTCPFFVANTNYLITIVRDGATKLMNVYVNGVLFVTNYNDAADDYVPATPATPILFFRDDNAISCEDRDGTVKFISLKPATSTAAEVTDTWTNICDISLPLRLLNFAAKTNNNDVLLNWQISNPVNSSYFEVERSKDGQQFSSLQNIAVRNNQQDYAFADVNGLLAANGFVFYRLKMVDRDGHFTYSQILRVQSNQQSSVQVFPNPAKDFVTIAGLPTQSNVQIFSMEGKLMLQQKTNAQSILLPVQQLANGAYTIVVTNNETTIRQKWVKQ